jgi:hypothetical protein
VQYVPSAQLTEHLVHTEALSPLYFPDSHCTHALAPDTFEYEPDVQLVHVAEEFAPAVLEYAPAGHNTHTLALVAPATDEYEPAGHCAHVFEPLAPAAAEYAPAGQFVHTALPVAILYVPAAHDVQTPPSGPVNPTLHVQAARAALEIGELELAGHAKHVAKSEAPVRFEYVATPQSVHVALPLVVLYFPATQPVHGPPSGPVKPALQICGIQALTSELPLGEVFPAGHVAQFPSPFMHPVTCTSAMCKVLYGPGIEI